MTGARLSPLLVVRRAAVASEVLQDLRDPALARWRTRLGELVVQERALAAQAVLRLEHLIGGEDDRALRRALLTLKRHLHNDRGAAAAQALPDMTAGGVAPQEAVDWHRVWRDVVAHRLSGETLVDRYRRRAEQRVVAELGRPGTAATVAVASESLGDALARLDRLRAKQRADALRSAAEYVTRAAARTTPYGGFTSVAIVRDGGPVGHGAEVRLAAAPTMRPRLNVEVLAALRSRVLADPAMRACLRVRMTDGIALVDGRLRYVRRKAGVVRSTGRVTQRSEDVFFLGQDALVDAVVGCFARQDEWELATLTDEVSAQVSGIASPAECAEYVAELLRQSFLVAPAIEFSVLEVDPLGRLVDELDALRGDALDDVVCALRDVQKEVDGLGAVTPAELVGALGRVRDGLAATGLDLAAVPRPLVYLDTVDGEGGRFDRAAWERLFGAHLARLGRILPLFDLLAPDRFLLREFVSARCGDGDVDDVLGFVQEFAEDLYDVYRERTHGRARVDSAGAPVPHLNWLSSPHVDEVNGRRSRLVEELGRRFDQWAGSGAAHLELDDDFFDAVAPRLPEPTPPDTFSVSAQVLTAGASPQLVVNGFYSGMNLMLSRFLHALPGDDCETVRAVRDDLRGLADDTTVLAEISGGHDSTNLNLHRQVLDWQLVCTGEPERGDPAMSIRLDELRIRNGHDGPFLWSDRLGVRVVPVYLGFLAPYALPDIQRILLLFSPMRVPVMDLWSGVDPPLGDAQIATHPRVTYGPLVLVRQVWKMVPGFVPRRSAQADPAAWLARLDEWRRGCGLPRAVFATTDLPARGVGGARARTKPQYVDFDSPLTLELLDRMLDGADTRVVMVEALPDPADPGVLDPTLAPAASEVVLEVRS